MPKYELKMPKLGESVQEATITKWMVSVGNKVEEDDNLLEIATDKVDSEIPSPVDGKILEILFPEGALVPVGQVIAIIDTEGEHDHVNEKPQTTTNTNNNIESKLESNVSTASSNNSIDNLNKTSGKFYSPLVKSIAKKEQIPVQELAKLEGSGQNGRVTKNDILNYVETRAAGQNKTTNYNTSVQSAATQPAKEPAKPLVSASISANDEIIEMDRMRKLIAQYMVNSKQVSPHVTTMVEADVTNIVLWRNKVKDEFEKRAKTKLTYMPVFTEAVAKALRDYPGVNAQVDGDRIILKADVNIGMAVALPSGNLIVPVIKHADKLNKAGLAVEINRLALAARDNKLLPDEIKGGTFTITNFGSFKNVMGTPIINQPEVAILAVGSIEKKPAVMEMPTGDAIVIRHKMFLSLSYDHRIVDGMLGGMFLRRIADYLEGFDMNTPL